MDDYEDWWAEQLSSIGYDSVFAARSDLQGQRLDDGLVTAFRKATFQLFCSQQLDLNDLRDHISDANLQAKATQNNNSLLVCLQPWERSALPTALCVVNTQLASAPALDHVRVLQAEFLCRKVATFNADFQLPILMAGSFNALPSSDVYHVIHTGRRRPVPQVPVTPDRPTLEEATATTITLTWPALEEEPGKDPVLGYKLVVKNCTSATMGFMHEIEIPPGTDQWTVTMLSAGITYQFRLAARNTHGWSHFSQPSQPMQTKLTAEDAKSIARNAAAEDKLQPVFTVSDVPPEVKPYDASFGSGRTPRFEDQRFNQAVCPRPMVLPSDSQPAEAKRYTTLAPRADRDEQLVHSEQFESAYASYCQWLCEPELTFSSAHFQGTIDYIFYSAECFAPFQLLALPAVDELEQMGQDIREPATIEDVEWSRRKPEHWQDAVLTPAELNRYMGQWTAPQVPNDTSRKSSYLPNAICPSDHLPLACVFAMKKDGLATTWN